MYPAPLGNCNWQSRAEWFECLATLPDADLHRVRHGGYGTMIRMLAHVVLVELGWSRLLLSMPYLPMTPESYASLAQVKQLSDAGRADVERFVREWAHDTADRVFESIRDGALVRFTYGEIAAHLIVHETHHIGQLSGWAREAGIEPPSSDVVSRGLCSIAGTDRRTA